MFLTLQKKNLSQKKMSTKYQCVKYQRKLPPIAGYKGDLVTRRYEIVTFRRTVLKLFNPFMPIVPTFAVRETHVSRTANVGTVGKNGLKNPAETPRTSRQYGTKRSKYKNPDNIV